MPQWVFVFGVGILESMNIYAREARFHVGLFALGRAENNFGKYGKTSEKRRGEAAAGFMLKKFFSCHTGEI